MVEKVIKINGIEDAKKLVGLAMKCDFQVDLVSDSITVDAKSIMGIFSLDFGTKTVLRLDCTENNEKVKDFTEFFA